MKFRNWKKMGSISQRRTDRGRDESDTRDRNEGNKERSGIQDPRNSGVRLSWQSGKEKDSRLSGNRVR